MTDQKNTKQVSADSKDKKAVKTVEKVEDKGHTHGSDGCCGGGCGCGGCC